MVKTKSMIFGRQDTAGKSWTVVCWFLWAVTVLLLFSGSCCQRPTPPPKLHSVERNNQQSQSVVPVTQSLSQDNKLMPDSVDSIRHRPEENKRRRGPRDVLDKECTKDDYECAKDKISMDAIVMLHSLLDDDHNGNVDQSESDEFLRDELQYTDGFERNSLFHGEDKLISVDDLWRAWKLSTVYNWTVSDVVDWLVEHVELPQYTDLFTLNVVDGTQLTRLATNNNHYISGVLGIKNPVHKQKLSVKAMDVVLFGPPKKGHSYMKDVAVVASLVIALGGCWFAYAQHKYSEIHRKRMMKDMEQLQKAEDTLMDMQNKLEKAEQQQLTVSQEKKNLEEKFRDEIETAKAEAERLKVAREGSLEEMSRLKLAEEELKQVRSALKRAEKELELRQTGIPSELQPYLQLTHEIELIHYHTKRQAAERQLVSAREECERVRKKRNTVMGAMRMAHSNSMDDIDQRIANARAALEEVRITLQERLHRWASVEHLCGFNIVTNPGLSTLCGILQRDVTPSGTIAYGAARPTLPVPLLGPVNIDDADEDLPPSYTSATVMSPLETLKKLSPTSSTLSKRSSGKDGRRHSYDPQIPKASNSVIPENRVTFDLGESSNNVRRLPQQSSTNGTSMRNSGEPVISTTTSAGMTKSKSHYIINGEHRLENGCGDLSSHHSVPNLCSDQRPSDANRPRVYSSSHGSKTTAGTKREDSHSGTESTDSTENERKKDKEKKRRRFLHHFLKKEKTS